MTAGDGRRGGDTYGEARDGAARRRWPLRVAAGAAVVALLAVAARVVVPGGSDTGADRERPKLHRWDLLGCYDLRVGPWRVSWRGDSAARRVSPGDRSAGRGSEADAAGPDQPPDRREAGVPASFEPPARLMLLPDSVDRWGRPLPSRRAVPRDGIDRPGRSLRWTIHGDTLWLVWSEEETRAGVALQRAGDSLTGRIRTVRGGDSLDATAPATARRVNCHTGAPEPVAGRPLDRR